MSFDELPKHNFGAILADPPWRFETWSDKGKDRAPDYETITTDELEELPVEELAKPDCVLFLWATWPMLEHAIDLIWHWGFEYKTCAFSWIKADASQMDLWRNDIIPTIGNGYWTRSNSEVCLLATRGHPKRLRRDVRQAIIEPRREHSRKPDCIHQRIELLVDGPYLELFARQRRPGWSCWGDEVDKFAEAL